MREECILCKAPLEYLATDIPMLCAFCGKQEPSKTQCQNGHYVCNDCHTKGMDKILLLCLQENSTNPYRIVETLMAQPFCHMHGPEHHGIVGAALLTAYRNAGGQLDLPNALQEMIRRGKQVPGGVCGFWGACGAGISTGMFVSIATGATPLAKESWGLSNRMTAAALSAIGEINGPRCCKRDSYLAIRTAIAFSAEHLGVEMESTEVLCTHSKQNNQCIGTRCPYFK